MLVLSGHSIIRLQNPSDRCLKQFKTNNFPLIRVNKPSNLEGSRSAGCNAKQTHMYMTAHFSHCSVPRSPLSHCLRLNTITQMKRINLLKLFWTYHFDDLMQRDAKLHANCVCFLEHGMNFWVIFFKQERQQLFFVIICFSISGLSFLENKLRTRQLFRMHI